MKVLKRSLKAIIGQHLINREILHTVFTAAERIAHSRPLTRSPLSPNNEDPLTPNHFLNVRPSVTYQQKYTRTQTNTEERDGDKLNYWQIIIGKDG